MESIGDGYSALILIFNQQGYLFPDPVAVGVVGVVALEPEVGE